MEYLNAELVEALTNIKSRIKAEMARRNGYGSLTDLSAPELDYNVSPIGTILSEHMQKIKDPLLHIKDFAKSNSFSQVVEPISGLQNMESFLTIIESEPMYGEQTSCRSACSGLCMGTCIDTCDGCSTGCQNGCTSCTSGCGAGCTHNCGGACNIGCGTGCNNICGGACNIGCGTGCTGGCNGCGGCTGSCKGGCTTSCNNSCGSNCSNSCGGGSN